MRLFFRRLVGNDVVIAKLNRLLHLEESQMADLSALTAEVEENGDAVESAIALLAQLAELIRSAPDQAALDDLAATLDAQSAALAAAVVANTPGAPSE